MKLILSFFLIRKKKLSVSLSFFIFPKPVLSIDHVERALQWVALGYSTKGCYHIKSTPKIYWEWVRTWRRKQKRGSKGKIEIWYKRQIHNCTSYPICPWLIPYNHPWHTERGKTGRTYQVVIYVYILLDLLEQSLVDLAKGKKLRMTHLLGKLKYDKKVSCSEFSFYLKTLVC